MRRYQNPDGSLTKEGKERYSGKFEETSKAYQDWFEKRMDLQRFKDKNIKEVYVEMQLKLGNESIFNKKVYMPKYDS